VGNRMIAFGDFPEPVDFVLARERVERQRADRRAFEEGLFRERIARDQIRREWTDMDWERDRGRERGWPPRPELEITSEGRQPRGLSSPERGLGVRNRI
jgi:hypothetical protein